MQNTVVGAQKMLVELSERESKVEEVGAINSSLVPKAKMLYVKQNLAY